MHTTSARQPCPGECDGYKFQRNHPFGRAVCVVAEEQGIDAEHRYVIVLEPHGALGPSFSSLRAARSFLNADVVGRTGYEWETEKPASVPDPDDVGAPDAERILSDAAVAEPRVSFAVPRQDGLRCVMVNREPTDLHVRAAVHVDSEGHEVCGPGVQCWRVQPDGDLPGVEDHALCASVDDAVELIDWLRGNVPALRDGTASR